MSYGGWFLYLIGLLLIGFSKLSCFRSIASSRIVASILLCLRRMGTHEVVLLCSPEVANGRFFFLLTVVCVPYSAWSSGICDSL